MKYKVTVLTPEGSARSAAGKISLQMLPIARTKETLFNDKEDEITFIFESGYKKFVRVSAFFLMFNKTMQEKFNSRTFKFMAKNKSRSEMKSMEKYYINPSSCEVIEQATDEEFNQALKGIPTQIKEKVIEWTKKLK